MDQQFDQSNPGGQNQYPCNVSDLSKPMTVGNFMVVLLIGIIPVVNIVMLFIWAFGSNTNINKKNYARAILIFMLIMIAIYIIFFIAFGALFMDSIRNMTDFGY